MLLFQTFFAQLQFFECQSRVLLFALDDLNELIDLHVVEGLREAGGWPEDLKPLDF